MCSCIQEAFVSRDDQRTILLLTRNSSISSPTYPIPRLCKTQFTPSH